MKTIHILIGSFLLASAAAPALADEKSITVTSDVSISSSVGIKCTAMGSQFSIATKKHLEKRGWSVQLKASAEVPNKGDILRLEIVNAISSFDMISGYWTSTGIEAQLYRDGILVDTYRRVRESSGMLSDTINNSCDVLAKGVNALGKDVSKWVKSQEI